MDGVYHHKHNLLLSKLGRQLAQHLTSRGHITEDHVTISAKLSYYTGITGDIVETQSRLILHFICRCSLSVTCQCFSQFYCLPTALDRMQLWDISHFLMLLCHCLLLLRFKLWVRSLYLNSRSSSTGESRRAAEDEETRPRTVTDVNHRAAMPQQ